MAKAKPRKKPEKMSGDAETEALREYVRSQRGQYPRLSAESGVGYFTLVAFGKGAVIKLGHDKVRMLQAHQKKFAARARRESMP